MSIRVQCFWVLLFLLLLIACDKTSIEEKSFRHWGEIASSGSLRVGTMTSPSAFFIYRGQEMGYEYDKISSFAEYRGLGLEVHLARSLDTLYHWMESGEIDLCITPLPLSRDNVDRYEPCGPIEQSSLVLAQLEGDSAVHYIGELPGREVYVLRNSAEELRLKQINLELSTAQPIRIRTVDSLGVSDLLGLLRTGRVSLVAVDRRFAESFARYYPEVHYDLALSSPVRYSWMTQRGNRELRDSVDAYFRQFKINHSYENSLANFYKDSIPKPRIGKVVGGVISPFDELFKQEAKRMPWHWTLLAAMAFQESTFRPNVMGLGGAMGLMGIMPSTGRSFGVARDELLEPEVAVRVAVDCLMQYRKSFAQAATEEDRLYMTLAAYNAGVGYVQDAVRLAEKLGYPSDKWFGGVQKCVLLKSNPEYYNDEVCRFGYMNGSLTENYVREIGNRMKAYQVTLQEWSRRKSK